MTSRLAARAFLAAAATLVAPATAAGARVETVVRDSGPIVAIAQDGQRVVWASIEPDPTCPSRIRSRNLETGAQLNVTRTGGPTCSDPVGFAGAAAIRLAVAGDRVAWTARTSGRATVERVYLVGRRSGVETLLDEVVSDPERGGGTFLGGLVGRAPHLLYGRFDLTIEGESDCVARNSCERLVSGGGTLLARAGGSLALPAAAPAALVAAGGGLIATVSPDLAGLADPGASATGTVEVRGAGGRELACSFTPSGIVLAPAVVRAHAIVLVAAAGKRYLEWYGTKTCKRLGSTQVPAGAAPELSAAGDTVLYRVGTTLRLLDLRTNGKSIAAATAGEPIGATLVGRRIVWAENRDAGGVVRTLLLPDAKPGR